MTRGAFALVLLAAVWALATLVGDSWKRKN